MLLILYFIELIEEILILNPNKFQSNFNERFPYAPILKDLAPTSLPLPISISVHAIINVAHLNTPVCIEPSKPHVHQKTRLILVGKCPSRFLTPG